MRAAAGDPLLVPMDLGEIETVCCLSHRSQQSCCQVWASGTQARFVTELVSPLQQIFAGRDLFGLHAVAQPAAICHTVGEQVIGKEIDAGPLVPRCGNGLHDFESLVTILDERDFARAVISEIDSHRGVADLFAFEEDESPWRIGLHHQPAADAPRLQEA